MANYFIRIEIYDAGIEQYEGLHESMQQLNMLKYVNGSSILDARALPDGCYFGASALSTEDIRNTVVTISRVFSSKEPSVFVVQVSDCAASLHRLGDLNYQ